eukprot:15464481-Alexandrium_andersonii.AAC.1
MTRATRARFRDPRQGNPKRKHNAKIRTGPRSHRDHQLGLGLGLGLLRATREAHAPKLDSGQRGKNNFARAACATCFRNAAGAD